VSPLDPELIQQFDEEIRNARRGGGDVARNGRRIAVTRQVDDNDVTLSTQQSQHRRPRDPRHAVGVHEQERLAFTGSVECDRQLG
jgi:hypothetical protein